jgi:hypothetical protein
MMAQTLKFILKPKIIYGRIPTASIIPRQRATVRRLSCQIHHVTLLIRAQSAMEKDAVEIPPLTHRLLEKLVSIAVRHLRKMQTLEKTLGDFFSNACLP